MANVNINRMAIKIQIKKIRLSITVSKHVMTLPSIGQVTEVDALVVPYEISPPPLSSSVWCKHMENDMTKTKTTW